MKKALLSQILFDVFLLSLIVLGGFYEITIAYYVYSIIIIFCLATVLLLSPSTIDRAVNIFNYLPKRFKVYMITSFITMLILTFVVGWFIVSFCIVIIGIVTISYKKAIDKYSI